jgi:tetratricopeptide (TPR) repeat protein
MAKFVRRNRTLVASLAAVLVALSAGLAVAAVGFRQAVAQRDLARQAEQTTERRLAEITKEQENNRVLIELLGDMYPRPWGMKTLGRQHTVYESIEELSASLEQRLRNHPTVEIKVRQIFGGAYSAAGEFDKARGHLNRALELALHEYGEQHETVAEIYATLADEVGWNYSRLRDNTTWLAQAEKAIEIYEALGVEESPGLGLAWFAKGHSLLAWPERKADAEAAQRKVIENHRRLAPDDGGWGTVISLWDLGSLLVQCGDDRLDDARIEFEKALKICRTGDRLPFNKATVLSGLGLCLRRQGDAAGAIESYREARNLFQSDAELRREPRGHRTGLQLAEMYFAESNIDAAFELVRQIEEFATTEGPVESLTDCLLLRGWLHFQLESYELAAVSFRQSMELAEERFGTNSTNFTYPCFYLAVSLEAQQRHGEAAAYFERMLPLTEAMVAMPHVGPLANFGYARALVGSAGDNDTQLQAALDVAQKGLAHVTGWPWPWNEPAFHHVIAKVHLRRGQSQAAIDSLQTGLQKATEPKATLRSSPFDLPTSRQELEVMLARIYVEDNRPDKAHQVLQEFVRIREEQLGADHIQVALAQLRLGEFLLTLSDYAAAKQPLHEAFEKLRPYAEAADPIRRRAANQLVELYTKLGQPEDVKQWQSQIDALNRTDNENEIE